jgi:hypothetical protein
VRTEKKYKLFTGDVTTEILDEVCNKESNTISYRFIFYSYGSLFSFSFSTLYVQHLHSFKKKIIEVYYNGQPSGQPINKYKL